MRTRCPAFTTLYSSAEGRFGVARIVYNLPDSTGRGWHVDVGHAQICERVDDGVDDRSWCPDGSELTAPFYTERIVCALGTQCLSVHHGDVISAWHAVIDERSGQKLARCFIIDALFAERLAYTLHQSAMDLTLDDHRIDDGADVIHCNITSELLT